MLIADCQLPIVRYALACRAGSAGVPACSVRIMSCVDKSGRWERLRSQHDKPKHIGHWTLSYRRITIDSTKFESIDELRFTRLSWLN